MKKVQKKQVVKKPAAKKPAAKKPAAKKPAAKKPVAKKPAAKKPVAKKPAAKKPAAKKSAAKKGIRRGEDGVLRIGSRKLKPAPKSKRVVKHVALRITRTATPAPKPQPQTYVPVDTAAAVAFAMSIAKEMKRSAQIEDQRRSQSEIRLTDRPTTRTKGKKSVRFPASDLKEFRKRLLEARDRARMGVTAMKATGFNEAEDHEADGGDGTNQTLRLQALGQMGNINRVLQQIEEALHRIDDGTYGVCTSCGQLIRKPRLLNQPFVLMCMECQGAMERERR